MTFPAPAPGLSALPLASLPVVVLDTETTGLDTRNDRIVQLGAVRIVHALGVFREDSIEAIRSDRAWLTKLAENSWAIEAQVPIDKCGMIGLNGLAIDDSKAAELFRRHVFQQTF